MAISHVVSTRLLRSVCVAAAIVATPTAVFPQTFVPQGPGYSIGPTETVQSGDI